MLLEALPHNKLVLELPLSKVPNWASDLFFSARVQPRHLDFFFRAKAHDLSVWIYSLESMFITQAFEFVVFVDLLYALFCIFCVYISFNFFAFLLLLIYEIFLNAINFIINLVLECYPRALFLQQIGIRTFVVTTIYISQQLISFSLLFYLIIYRE